MISRNMDSPSWRDFATARAVSSTESHAGSVSAKVADFRKEPLEPAAWDPYEVWLTRVKQPRDAQKK